MKLVLLCNSASELKERILSDSEDGVIKTWGVVVSKQSGKLLTHTPEQWNEKVLLVLTPSPEDGKLEVVTSFWRGKAIPTEEDKSYYLGRFVEILLANYRQWITTIEVIVKE